MSAPETKPPVQTTAPASALAPAPPPARRVPRFPCVIDATEHAIGKDATCNSIQCRRLFKCLPEKDQLLIEKTYLEMRVDVGGIPLKDISTESQILLRGEILMMHNHALRRINRYRNDRSNARYARMMRTFK